MSAHDFVSTELAVIFVTGMTVVAVLSLLFACSSVMSTMSRTRRMWDETEQALHSLRKILREIEADQERQREAGTTRRKSS